MAWTIDAAHSEITFTVRHMMISNVRGRFEEFSGSVDLDESDLTTLKAEIAINTGTISTRDEKRDAHLRSDDFFASDRHPVATFKATSVEKVGESRLKVQGDLKIRDITRPVTLDVEVSGPIRSPWGSTSIGFSGHTTINRTEWNLVWNQALETGGILVGDDVKLNIELELIKQ
ncbi:MAG TPA: YceI family protein [Candidatus Kapabacteria bacterium]|nr:YceI family protein [Candidatus Kapabacteria bacterium]